MNEQKTVGDWVGMFVAGQSGTSFLDWSYMNGTKNFPLSPISDATLAFVASTACSCEFQFYRNNSTLVADRMATAAFTVSAQGLTIKIGPGVTWKIGPGVKMQIGTP
jgi:hypothetical protein